MFKKIFIDELEAIDESKDSFNHNGPSGFNFTTPRIFIENSTIMHGIRTQLT